MFCLFGKEKNQRYCQISLSSSFTLLFRKNMLFWHHRWSVCDDSRDFGHESTQMSLSEEENEKEREENSQVLEPHRDSLLRNVMIIDDGPDALLFLKAFLEKSHIAK